MSVFSKRPALRWAVPSAVVALVAAGGFATQASAADGPSLPARTASQLLADLASTTPVPLSGTVSQTSDLGLPSLPTSGSDSSTDLTSLLTGDHTLQVWTDGAQKSRVAVSSQLGESDVVRSGDDLWTWSSTDHTASHRTLAAHSSTPSSAMAAMTPQDAATSVLSALDPTTVVSTGATVSIAGQDAYQLVLRPKDSGSLIGEVVIAVDAVHHVPLRVEVLPQGTSNPAVDVAFTSVDFAAPAASEFTFTPPAGTTVTEGGSSGAAGTEDGSAKPGDEARPSVVGTGWTSVVVARTGMPGMASPLASADSSPSSSGTKGASSLLSSLPAVSGAWGKGRLLSSTLVSVLITDDGRVFAGAVSPQRLYEVAATTPAS